MPERLRIPANKATGFYLTFCSSAVAQCGPWASNAACRHPLHVEGEENPWTSDLTLNTMSCNVQSFRLTLLRDGWQSRDQRGQAGRSRGEPSVPCHAPTGPGAAGVKKHWQDNEAEAACSRIPLPALGYLNLSRVSIFPLDPVACRLVKVAFPTVLGLRSEDRKGRRKLA